MINPKCHNTGCNYPEGECPGACCCNGDCDQGRACPRRKLPVLQFADDEPEPADGLLFWLALAGVALAVLAGTGVYYLFQLAVTGVYYLSQLVRGVV